jgi:tRNA (guanine-N7-)-methyltransferase
MERPLPLGRPDFDVDPGQQQEATERYDEGRGLIGGDPNRRPAHVRWRPIPEEQPYFRLIDVSAEKRARLADFLTGELGGTQERRKEIGGTRRNSEELDEVVETVQTARTSGPLEVEIGFGTGEFLLGRAGANPGHRFLGFEVKRDLCRSVVKQVQRVGLENVWISDDDARWALPQLGLTGRVDAIHVLYPDPWWKRRHQVKRLFTLPFLDLVRDLLIPGGLLHVRSDVEGYAQLIVQVVAEHGGFSANDPALAAPFDADPPTQREAYCRQIDRPFWVLGLRRVFGQDQQD